MARTNNPDGSITLTLAYPVKSKAGDIVQLTLQRPRARHYKLTDSVSGPVGKSMRLLEAVAGVDERDLGDLDSVDWNESQEIINSFSTPVPATTST
jgi:hypothetical protein